jgi:hypothetical protein
VGKYSKGAGLNVEGYVERMKRGPLSAARVYWVKKSNRMI